MANQILEQVKSQTGNVREQIKQKREKLVSGCPGQTEIAGNVLEEAQARMSERFDVMQERRPRLLADILKIDELPIDITEKGGGVFGMINKSSSNTVDVSKSRTKSKSNRVDVSDLEFSGRDQRDSGESTSGMQFSG